MSIDVLDISKQVLDKILKIADGGAVLTYRSISHQLRFSQNKIDIIKTWRETSVNMLLEKDQKVNVLYITYPGLENIDKILETARIALEKAQPRPYYAPLPEPAEKYPKVEGKIDEETRDKPEKMSDIAKTIIDTATSEGAKRVAGSIRGNYLEIGLATSSNVELKDAYTNSILDVRAFIDGTVTGHGSQIARGFKYLEPKKVSAEAAENAKLNHDQRTLEPGRYDTLLTPNASAAIMNLLAGSSSAFSVLMGFSFFKDKLGQNVATEEFNLHDNPLEKESGRPRIFDDEGVPTRKNTIIENGVLKTYLHNRFTAKIFNAEHTGNAGWISPSPWHLFVEPGDAKREELLEHLNKGIVVNNITYIRFQNYVQGDFSGIIRDGVYYVEDGEIKFAVKGLRFSDNTLRILKNIEAIGSDVQNIFHWWLEYDTPVRTPSLLVKQCGYTKAHGE